MKKSVSTGAMLAALVAVVALVIAGCGGGSSSTSAAPSSGAESASAESAGGGAYGKPAAEEEAPAGAAAETASGETTPVSLGSAAGVGQVLVDSQGMTLYYFQKDQKGSGKSKCEGACAEAWPPLTSEGEAKAMSGVDSSKLGTIERSDGTTQVTYAGWPLYTFVEDQKPGEDNGTDVKAFGASWYPLHSNGQKAGH
jgi:predicted lipoprotein with Yx(FWY)xxD motif